MMFKIGDICVCQNYQAFRSRKPFKILNIQKDQHDRNCYFIQFEDGRIDWLPVGDEKDQGMNLISDILKVGEEKDTQ